MVGQLDVFVKNVLGVGWFQVYISAAMSVILLLTAWGMMMMTFGSYDPGWECDIQNSSKSEGQAVDKLLRNQTYSVETIHGGAVFPLNFSREDKCELAKSCPRIVFTPGTSTIVTEWTLICDRAWISSLIISIQMVGVTLGSYAGGYLGDRYGRKIALYPLIILFAVSNFISVFSVSWQMFATLRLFIGFSIGGMISISVVVPLEVLPGKWRTASTAFPAWYIGCVLLGLLVWFLKDWRQTHIATGVVSIFGFLLALWAPESLRWLVANGKATKAEQVARKMCEYNRKRFSVKEWADFTEDECNKETETLSVSLLFQKTLMKKTFLGTLVYSMVSIMFYAVSFGIRVLFGDIYINFIVYSVLIISAAPTVPVLGNKLGRRWGALAFLGTSCVLSVCVVVVSLTMPTDANQLIITGLALTGTVSLGCAWCVLNTFFPELFPTSLRTLAFGFMLVGARIGGILAPFMFPEDPRLLYVTYLIMSAMTLACCAIIFCLPETKGRHMDDTIQKAGRSFKDNTVHCKENIELA